MIGLWLGEWYILAMVIFECILILLSQLCHKLQKKVWLEVIYLSFQIFQRMESFLAGIGWMFKELYYLPLWVIKTKERAIRNISLGMQFVILDLPSSCEHKNETS